MSKKPIIGISGSILIDEGGMFPGYERAYVNNDYIESVERAGGIPYIIPMVYNEETIRQQVENVDALILSGGHDVNPLLFGEEPSQKLGGIMPKRDVFDFKLLEITMAEKKPILGICRGHQVINVANGGSLYQDLSLMEGCYIKHNQEHLSNIPTHTVEIKEGTILEEILGQEILTNSFHHLGVKDVPKGFKVAATAKDGMIEAIESETQFILGIQWHPEMMSKDNKHMAKIFERFVEEAKKN